MKKQPATTYPQTHRSILKRHPERGSALEEDVLEILQKAKVVHLAWSVGDEAVVIPMGFGLWGGEVILHGSLESRLMTTLGDGRRISGSVTLLDGLVLARSAFHSSMNYRSVVFFGRCRRLEDAKDKREALDAFVDHVIPGRSQVARPMTEAEIEGTEVLALRIEEATAKVRQGPPKEPEADLAHPIWAGVIPLSLETGEPIDAPDLEPGFEPPDLS